MGLRGRQYFAPDGGRDGEVVGTEVIAYRPICLDCPGVADSRNVGFLRAPVPLLIYVAIPSLRMLAGREASLLPIRRAGLPVCARPTLASGRRGRRQLEKCFLIRWWLGRMDAAYTLWIVAHRRSFSSGGWLCSAIL